MWSHIKIRKRRYLKKTQVGQAKKKEVGSVAVVLGREKTKVIFISFVHFGTETKRYLFLFVVFKKFWRFLFIFF